jgi:hypothetical protein
MNYHVDWAPRAEQLLAAVWLAARNRGAVTAAAAWLDAELADAPLRFGDPIDSSIHRVGYHDVLGIEFEVIEDDKRVIVHGVFSLD